VNRAAAAVKKLSRAEIILTSSRAEV